MFKRFTFLIAVLLASLAFSALADDGDVISFTYSYYNNQTMYARVLSEADKTAELIPNPDGVTVYNMSQSSMWITPTNANGYTIVSIGENAFKNARIGQPTNYSAGLSAGFTTIKADAFNGATRNGSVISVFRINAEMADISPKAFRNNKIKWFDFRTNEQSVNYGNLNHILTNVEKTKLVAFPGNYVAVSGSSQLQTTSLPTGSVATSYTIPSQITTIGAYAFSDNSKLQTLNLGSVTTIEEQACANMSALKTLTIPATVTSIEADAFTGTTGITTLNVKCEWSDDLAGVVFDDAVYERLKDAVNWQCSEASKALFKANPNWGRFFTGGGAPLETYTISYGSMTNGTVTGPTETDNGMLVTLTATPDAHYELGTLTVTDADNNPVEVTPGENGTYTFVMPASNVTVNATFTRLPVITITSIANGAVTANADEALAGTTVTLTATPDAHYELGTLTVTDADNNPVEVTPGENGTYTFVMPASNVTVNATFTRLPVITIASIANGAVTANADEASAGTTVTLTATPASLWYELGTLTVTDADNNPVEVTPGDNGTFTFMMPASNVTVNATFVEGHKLFMMGSMNGWDGNNTENMVELAYDTTAQTYSVRQPLPDSGDGYAYFRLKDMNNQYGPTGGADKEITEADLDTALPITTGHADKAFKIAAGQNFTFTVNEDKSTLTVIGLDKTPFQDGKFYYSAVSAGEVEIVPNPNGTPYTALASSHFKQTVTNPNGDVFTVVGFGVEALKNAVFSNVTSASYNSAAIEQNYPDYRYIKSHAFDGVQADAIRFYNVKEIAPDAFVNNSLHGLIANVSGYTTNLTSDFSYPSNVISSISVLGTADRTKVLAFPGNARVNSNDKTSAKISTINSIGGSIQEIGAYAFYGNKNLRTVNFGTASVVKTVADSAFANTLLTTIILPASLETIGTGAFAGVTTLTSVRCNAVVPPAGGVFDDAVYQACKDRLVVPDGSEDAYRADENWGKFFSQAYSVIINENISHGSVVASSTLVPEGASVTLTVIPAESYEFDSLTVTDADDNPVTTTPGDNGTYTFVMPASNVFVTASFSAAPQMFVLGQVNGNNWAANVGVPMTYDAVNKSFTATVTTTGNEAGYSYFSFTTALAENNDDGGWAYIAPFRFGATGDGNHTLVESELGTAIAATGTQNIGVPAGTWTIKVENVGEENQQVTITGTWPTTKYYYNANGQVVELTVNNGTATYALNTENEVYFNFAKRLDSGSMPMTYFGTASNYDVQRTDIGNAITLTDGEGFFKLPAGEWTLTLGGLNTAERTLTVTGQWPSNGRVYMLGTNQNWNPNDGSMELTYDPQSQTYSIEFTAQPSGAEGEENYNFFSFTKALGSWSDIAGSRLGAAEDGKLIEFAEGEFTATADVQAGTNSFKIAAGEPYTLTLNYEMTQLTVATYDKSPFTDGVVYYKPISYNECEIIPHPNGTAYNLSNNNTALDKEVVTNAHGDVFTIVGIAKFAFKNAQFQTNGNFNMPHKIRYVADSAFQGVKSGSSTSRGSIRFYGNTLRYLSSTAFLNNQLQGSVLVSSGDAENGFAQVSSDVTSPSTSGGSMYLIAERGTKYILFPNSYPLGNSNGWEPANKITINANIKEIGAYAMMNITNYKTVIMSNVEVIDTAAFMNSGVTTLNLGNALISIGPDAFTGATGITTITISTATPPAVESDFEQAVYNRNNVLNLTGDAAANKLAYMAHPIWGKFFKGSTLQATLDGATDGEARKVSDALTIAMVDADEEVLYMADDNGAAAQAPEDGWIDFVGEHLGKPYTAYSHNNWLAVKVADASGFETGMVVEGLVGTFSKASASLNAASIQLAEGMASVTPNTYIVANLGGPTQLYGLSTFFFMQPVVNEVVTVTWAQYAGNGLFKVPDNASYFTGQLQVVGDMTGMTPIEGTIYTLDGVLVAQEAADGQKLRDGSLVMKNANVYQDQSIVTGLGDLRVNGKVTGVRYYNVAGMASDRPFDGVNIVVTTYADGTQNVSKVIR